MFNFKVVEDTGNDHVNQIIDCLRMVVEPGQAGIIVAPASSAASMFFR